MKRAIPVSLLVQGTMLAFVGVVGHLYDLGAKPALPVLIAVSGVVAAICGGLMLGVRRGRAVAEYALGLGLYALAMQAIIGWRTAADGAAHRPAIPIAASVLAITSLGLLLWLFASPASAFGPTPAPGESSGEAARGHPPAKTGIPIPPGASPHQSDQL